MAGEVAACWQSGDLLDMAESETTNAADFWRPALARSFADKGCFGPVLTAWVLAAGFLIISVYFRTDFSSPVWGPDDAMRLVEIRDLLAGQGWFDLSQSRLDPAQAVVMHWSRIIDLPLALMMTGFGFVFDAITAERIVLLIWPLALLFALIWVSARLAIRIGGKKSLWAGVILPVLALGTLGEFLPGRIDHHGAQIVLTLWLLLLILDAQKDLRSAILAGLTAVLSMAIGLEPMPFVAAAVCALGMRWAIDGHTHGRGLIGFGGAIALSAPVLFALTAPDARFLATACDAFSPAHLLALTAGGAGYILLGLFSSKLGGRAIRTVTLFATAGAVLGLIGFAYPECLTDPYGHLDPALKTLWLQHVIEAQSAASLLSRAPEQLLQYYLMPAAGLAVCVWAAIRARGPERADWIVLSLFVALGLALALYQVRGAKFAYVLAAPAGAWAIATLYERYRSAMGSYRLRYLAGFMAACFLFSAVFHQGAAARLGTVIGSERAMKKAARNGVNPTRACQSSAALAPLNGFAPGLILAPRNLGAHLLLETHHSVLAANYHRNQRGLLLALDILNTDQAIARRRAKANKVRYLLHCPGLIDSRSDGKIAADALVTKLDGDDVPFWLEPVPLNAESPLKLYRLR